MISKRKKSGLKKSERFFFFGMSELIADGPDEFNFAV